MLETAQVRHKVPRKLPQYWIQRKNETHGLPFVCSCQRGRRRAVRDCRLFPSRDGEWKITQKTFHWHDM